MMNINRCIFIAVLLAIASSSLAQQKATITIDAGKTGNPVSPTLHGIFFEEISHAGEGGLYAELIQNRGFEDANLPPACHLENGQVIPPRTPHFWNQPRVSDWKMPWNVKSEWPAWSLQTTGGSAAMLALVETKPLNQATPHSLQVNVTNVASGGRVAVINEGFWGIAVQQGEDYKLSVYARVDQAFNVPVT